MAWEPEQTRDEPAPERSYFDDGPDATSGPATGRRTTWLLSGLAMVAILVIGAFVLAPRASSPDGVPGPIVDAEPQMIAPAAPWDGKASLRLPITVTPNRDLVDGQEVVVSGSGFPPGADLGVLMCTNAAAYDGVNACDLGTALSSFNGFPIVADGQGNFTTRYRVQTHFSIPSGVPTTQAIPTTVYDRSSSGPVIVQAAPMTTVDCTTGDIDPDQWKDLVAPTKAEDRGGFTCIVAAGMISDYDQSGGAAVGFAGSTFRTFETIVPTTTTLTTLVAGDTEVAPTTTEAPVTTVGGPTSSTPSSVATTVVVPPPTVPPTRPPGTAGAASRGS